MIANELDHQQFGLLFDIRRSIRYHDRRRNFFEVLHRITALLTILMAGSVLFDIGKDGETAWWLITMGVIAALIAATDMVINYASLADLHRNLKSRFCELEKAMLAGDTSKEKWKAHQLERLTIEQDEPPVFRALDILCRNEVAIAHNLAASEVFEMGMWPTLTCHFYSWPDIAKRLHRPKENPV